jgi:hypothetical protein
MREGDGKSMSARARSTKYAHDDDALHHTLTIGGTLKGPLGKRFAAEQM